MFHTNIELEHNKVNPNLSVICLMNDHIKTKNYKEEL